MKPGVRYLSRCLLLCCLVVSPLPLFAAEVILQPTPDRGLQPRLLNDESGNLHLLYFRKRLRSPAAREGNLYYRQFDFVRGNWGQPVKVSSTAFNLQTFSIARAEMAVGGDGRIHVIWYLPRQGEYFYTRSDPERSAFEVERSMVHEYGVGLDAAANVAASDSQVAIVWAAGDLSREYERTVYARISTNAGASFGPEQLIGNSDLGACACCSLATDFTAGNDLVVAYRSAIDGVGRHMQLLTAELAQGDVNRASYGPVHQLQQWEATFCPLSTNQITRDTQGERTLVFETEFRIVEMALKEGAVPRTVADPFSETRQKNPSLAFNDSEEKLIAWGEAISHSRGGRLNWQLYDADGEKIAAMAEELEIPEFSFPAAATLPDGSFLILY